MRVESHAIKSKILSSLEFLKQSNDACNGATALSLQNTVKYRGRMLRTC